MYKRPNYIMEVNAEEALKITNTVKKSWLEIFDKRQDEIIPIIETITDLIENHAKLGYSGIYIECEDKTPLQILKTDFEIIRAVIAILEENSYQTRVDISKEKKTVMISILWSKKDDRND